MTVCAREGCENEVPPRNGPSPPPKYCTPRCRRRANKQATRQRLRDSGELSARRKARREAVKGRECRWCGVYDSECRWSLNNSECSACNRVRHRNGKCDQCGRPRFKLHNEDPHCMECDADWLLSRRRAVQILMIHPDGRERMIIRCVHTNGAGGAISGAARKLGPIAIEPTPEQWARMR